MAFSGHIWKLLACLTSTSGERVKFPEVCVDVVACGKGKTCFGCFPFFCFCAHLTC